MELWQRLNWGMSMSYACTLGDWMLIKINNNQIGGKEEHSRGVKLQWPPTTLIVAHGNLGPI